MKTLKYMPIPEDSPHPHLLAWAENDIYTVKIRYLGEKDFASIEKSELSADDLMINIYIKKTVSPPYLYPSLNVILGNKDLGTRQWFYIQMNFIIYVSLEEMPRFLELLAVAKDTLSDVKEMIYELDPDLLLYD